MSAAPIAFIWGDDSFAIEAAIETFRTRTDLFPGDPPERWRVEVDAGSPARTIGQLGERLQTGALFGSGTLAVVPGAAPLVRRAEDRAALVALFGAIAPGNGLAFAEETETGRKEPPHRLLVEAIRAAGGPEIPVRAPKAGELAKWIADRARERRIQLAPDAARALAERVGGFVVEGDADRRQQARLAVMELDKLALYRAEGAPVTAADVRALVAEAVPSSTFALVDAVGRRLPSRAIELAERLFESTPEPVVLAALHRRIRELLEILDRVQSGEQPRELPRSMKLNPYYAERLAGQAAQWSLPELEAALEGLLDLDAMLKGVPGLPGGDAQRRLAFVRWISEKVARPV
jgi:DNA polymerase III delta subunit